MMLAERKQAEERRPLTSWRCNNCGLMLGRFYLIAGSILEVKCPRCKAMNVREKQ